MAAPRELKDLPKGAVKTQPSAPVREAGESPLAPLAGPTPKGEVVSPAMGRKAPGSNNKPH